MTEKTNIPLEALNRTRQAKTADIAMNGSTIFIGNYFEVTGGDKFPNQKLTVQKNMEGSIAIVSEDKAFNRILRNSKNFEEMKSILTEKIEKICGIETKGVQPL